MPLYSQVLHCPKNSSPRYSNLVSVQSILHSEFLLWLFLYILICYSLPNMLAIRIVVFKESACWTWEGVTHCYISHVPHMLTLINSSQSTCNMFWAVVLYFWISIINMQVICNRAFPWSKHKFNRSVAAKNCQGDPAGNPCVRGDVELQCSTFTPSDLQMN